MAGTKVDAELIRQIARSLDRAADNMDPKYDRPGAEDRVQPAEGRRSRIDTLAGSTTDFRNFGGFENGQRLRKVYGRAHARSVDDADVRRATMRRYADALRECLDDLEGSDTLSEEHFRALARLTRSAKVGK